MSARTLYGPCAECGHLHYLGPRDGYAECPIDGCECKGQAWAWSASFLATRETPAELNAGVADCLRSLALQADRYDHELDELRDTVARLLLAVDAIAARVDALPGSGSVKS